MAGAAPRRMTADAGIVFEWLVRLIVLLGLAGVLFVEAVGVGIARYAAAEAASAAATQAALAIRAAGIQGDAETAARNAAAAHGCTLVALRVSHDRDTVSVTVAKQARTFLVHRFSRLQGLTRVRASEDASFRRS